MISLDEALAIISNVIVPVPQTETCPLSTALGRICAETVTAPRALPPFTNTGVDGYAFQHEQDRTTFTLVGTSYAGEPYQGKVSQGEAVRIATGAMLPDGADTVIMQEVCTIENNILHIKEVPEKNANLRLAGSDIAQGQSIMKDGTCSTVQDIALLGALGVQNLSVKRTLKIAIASTGLELRQMSEHSNAGQIIDTNSLMLTQMLSRPGIQTTKLPALPDEYDATSHALKTAAAAHDVIITTGGVSVGDRDYVRDVLHKEGTVHFWKIAIRPGKPVLVATIGRCIVIGLPGNPVSAFVTCNLIVRAVLRALWGQDPSLPEGFTVPLAEDVTKPEHLRCFIRAGYKQGAAHPYSNQSSHVYASLTNATGLIDLPVGKTDFSKNELVIFRPFSFF